MITSTDLVTLFRQALQEHWGYIWGTSGEPWTFEKQAALEKTTDENRAQGRQYGSKWIGHTVADCSGLFVWAFRRLGGTIYHGSDTMYRKYCSAKGELKKGLRTDHGALKPGTAVFVWNGKSYSHVGLYVGDGTVIEAMGTIAGVTTTRVSLSKWTYWGELAGVDYTVSAADPAPAAEAEGTKPTLRRGDKGDAVRDIQTLLSRLGYDLGSCGVDGDFGRATEAAVKRFQSDHGLAADGIVGKITRAGLEKAAAAVPPDHLTAATTYSLTIPGLDWSQARALSANYPGCTLTEERS